MYSGCLPIRLLIGVVGVVVVVAAIFGPFRRNRGQIYSDTNDLWLFPNIFDKIC